MSNEDAQIAAMFASGIAAESNQYNSLAQDSAAAKTRMQSAPPSEIMSELGGAGMAPPNSMTPDLGSFGDVDISGVNPSGQPRPPQQMQPQQAPPVPVTSPQQDTVLFPPDLQSVIFRKLIQLDNTNKKLSETLTKVEETLNKVNVKLASLENGDTISE